MLYLFTTPPLQTSHSTKIYFVFSDQMHLINILYIHMNSFIFWIPTELQNKNQKIRVTTVWTHRNTVFRPNLYCPQSFKTHYIHILVSLALLYFIPFYFVTRQKSCEHSSYTSSKFDGDKVRILELIIDYNKIPI